VEDLNAHIDELLEKERPDRYDSGDKSWMDPIVAVVEGLIPAEQASSIAASGIVYLRETQATKSANRFLRAIDQSGQQPLDWFDYRRRPIAWDEHRVCLEVAEAFDFRDWATVERRRAATDFVQRNNACGGAEWLADRLDDTGARTIRDLP
jgi:hypothetical protein